MVNWYYVIGSDRVGPVSVAALQVLFMNGEITNETYIWKKGFTNWERLKDVAELNFDTPPIDEVQDSGVTPTIIQNEIKNIIEKEPVETTREINLTQFKKEKEESPEINFSFDWKTIRKNDELFFVKVGKDRSHSDDDIYGPYSMVEIKEAMEGKRINLNTLIYSAGMNSWIKIQDTPINDEYNGISASEISLAEIPILIIFNSTPLPLVTIVKKAGIKEAVLLGAGAFTEFQYKTVKASLYLGSELKVKNVQVQVQSYDKKDQTIECYFVDMDSHAKKIMLNHAV